MAISKNNGAVADKPVETPTSRPLNTTPPDTHPAPSKGRDFDAEARGKVACVAYNAALASPGLACLSVTSIDQYLALVEKAADAAVAYTWKKQKGE